ncbi:bifunctional folylpolyglutamate synthase/dihydrofolate synthase [Lysinibacillus piscis]|uniref:tetrahydrofolate synthase n=1 Tax=Lysinibacillus piscis TaxID=2518931 RepID=A0ABQ5NJ73_9BACI|nr:folylpolyglutamate synthase/dihydrofolate synthase family protein [Lysinibacillus sp. KH24]GLC88422.1 folylpolyglutamate synthase [Lysinibacillus sp. KH24]
MIPGLNPYKERWHMQSDDVIKPGLAAIEEALVRLGNPEKQLQVVHIAGTNGKGSTLTFLEAIAQAHGLRVGKFMSPCIVDVHDQIQVDGQYMTVAEMDAVFQQMQEAGLSGVLTDFELLTVAAFLHFVTCDVDVALIEAGMGGLLDSTNVVLPMVSIIPSIALEHTQFLGNTLTSIAQHKAGIIKPSRPVIIGDLPNEAREIVVQTAQQQSAPLLTLHQDFDVLDKQYVHHLKHLYVPKLEPLMKGAHQVNNMALAITAFIEIAALLHIEIKQEAIQQGVRQAKILGRFEEILPSIIVDGAHNPASAEQLVATIQQHYPNEPITMVVGILADKDVKAVLQLLEQVSDCFYFVDFNNPRAMAAKDMLALSNAAHKEIVEDYVWFLQQQSAARATTIVTGSLYLLTDIRTNLQKKGKNPSS